MCEKGSSGSEALTALNLKGVVRSTATPAPAFLAAALGAAKVIGGIGSESVKIILGGFLATRFLPFARNAFMQTTVTYAA